MMLARMNSEFLFYTPKKPKQEEFLNLYQRAFIELLKEFQGEKEIRLSPQLNQFLKDMKPISPASNKTPHKGSFAAFRGTFGESYDKCIEVLDVIANQLSVSEEKTVHSKNLMSLNLEIQMILRAFIKQKENPINNSISFSSCAIL